MNAKVTALKRLCEERGWGRRVRKGALDPQRRSLLTPNADGSWPWELDYADYRIMVKYPLQVREVYHTRAVYFDPWGVFRAPHTSKDGRVKLFSHPKLTAENQLQALVMKAEIEALIAAVDI